MTKHTNVVRFRVKKGHQNDFESILSKSEKFEGQLSHVLAKTGEQTYVGYGLWENEDKMAAARKEMIALLDSVRHLLEEISPELGVTDPVSGPVIYDK
mgnify:CR=1 FL=1|tara:strand:- start:460 stop:753 length:294 start_codon:yes stop_codon:yes gene_type:complete